MKTKRVFLWAGPLVLSLLIIACGLAGQTSDTEATSEPNSQGDVGGGEIAAGGLNTYHIHSVKYEGGSDGPVMDESTSDVILDPLSVHYIFADGDKTTMEVIVVGNSVWTKFLESDWTETQQTDIQGQLEQMGPSSTSPLDIQEGVPLEGSFTWLMGQPHLNIAEGSMTMAGEETINSIRCKKYTVDSTYFYTITTTVPLNVTSTVTFRDQGEVWVADQSGWSSFVVRARLDEVVTTEVSGNSSTEKFYIEHDVTDVNSPNLKIEPPQ